MKWICSRSGSESLDTYQGAFVLWDGVGKLLGNRRVTEGQWTASANANLLQFSVADITFIYSSKKQRSQSSADTLGENYGKRLIFPNLQLVSVFHVGDQRDFKRKLTRLSGRDQSNGKRTENTKYAVSVGSADSEIHLIIDTFSPKFENYILPKRNVYLVKQW